MADGKNVLYRVDINISAALGKLSQLNKEFTKIEKTGTQSTKNVSTQGAAHVRQLGFAFDRMGINGVAALGEVFAAIGPIGLAIAAVIIPTIALTKAFSALVKTAVDGFKAIVDKSIETGRIFDTTKAQFLAVFEGVPEAADAAFGRVREISRDLGFDATELSRAFIPEVENLDQLEEIVKIAAALGRIDPTQGVQGATIALREFLQEGNVTSLIRRFELSRTALNRIKEIMNDQGLGAGLEALQAELERTGRDAESLSDTFEVSVGRMQEFLRDLAGAAGEPIIDELKDSIGGLLSFVQDNFGELQTVAFAFGNAVAGVIDSLADIGEKILGDISPEDIANIADQLTRLGEAAELLTEFSGDFLQDLDASNASKGIDFLTNQLIKLHAWLTFIQATLAGLGQVGVNTFGDIGRVVGTISGDDELVKSIEELQSMSGLERFNQAIDLGRERMADFHQEVETGIQKNHAYADSLGESTDAAEALANAQLAIKQATEDIANGQEELAGLDEQIAEKERDVADKRLDFTIDRQRAEFDLELKHSRELIDLAEEVAQAREDAARENLQKISDIYRKHFQDIADAARDLRRDEEDIAIDFSRKQQDIDKDEAEKRLDIETDYRRRLEEIRRRFEFDSQEAIRANDAIEFLRIQRRLQFELDEEEQARDESTEDAAIEAQRRRDELAQQQAQEIEDARLANQRKLEDLQISLNQALEAQRINYARELEELRINEQRKREEVARSQQREAEDFKRAWDRRAADLKRALARELEELRRFAIERRRIMAEIQRAQNIINTNSPIVNQGNNGPDLYTPTPTTQGTPPPDLYTPTPATQGLTSRDAGGPVYPGRPYLSGVPELFIPNRVGMAIPLNKLMFSPPAQRAGAPQIVDNSRKQQIDVSLIDPSKMSAMEVAIARNVLLQMLDGLQ